MVNVDFTPSLVLGLGMIGGGLGLYQVRLSRPWISRDYDVVISSISILTGGILVFQVTILLSPIDVAIHGECTCWVHCSIRSSSSMVFFRGRGGD